MELYPAVAHSGSITHGHLCHAVHSSQCFPLKACMDGCREEKDWVRPQNKRLQYESAGQVLCPLVAACTDSALNN